MSVLDKGEAAPSRVKGVVHFLQQTKGLRENRNTLEALLSPTNLISKGDNKEVSRNMIHITVSECIKMGLLVENRQSLEVALNPNLDLDDSSLSHTLAQLFLRNSDYKENYDLAKVLAWYLAQDFFDAPGNWQEFQQRLREQIGIDLLGLNDVRFGQFEDWSCYLGFAWRNCYLINKDGKTQKKSVLLPDPTAYLRKSLGDLFESVANQQIPLGEFINRLGRYCPVFETGTFREEIEEQLGGREPNYLSSVTSLSLRRLEEEGLIKLDKLSDITVWVFQDGTDSRISHITWIDKASQGGNV